jgi:hypothetical protein
MNADTLTSISATIGGCRRCDCYFLTPRAFCECCGLQLKATPVRGEYKARIRAKKILVPV